MLDSCSEFPASGLQRPPVVGVVDEAQFMELEQELLALLRKLWESRCLTHSSSPPLSKQDSFFFLEKKLLEDSQVVLATRSHHLWD